MGDSGHRVLDGGSEAGSEPPLPGEDTIEIEPGTHEQFCMGQGPAVRIVPDAKLASSPVCMPGIGRRLFAYALCSCGDLSWSSAGGSLSIDSFDSRAGRFVTGQSGAAVGLNGSLVSLTNVTSLNGTAIIGGTGVLSIAGTASFGGDLKTNGPVELIPNVSLVSVARDLWVNGDVRGDLISRVGRDLYQPPGGTGAQTLNLRGQAQTRNFSVPPPCACGSEAKLDIAAIVASAQAQNDNAQLGVSAAELSEALAGGTAPVELGCGRFAIGTTAIRNDSLASVSGRLALFVNGDLEVDGDFGVDLGASGQLDVFVTGDLIVSETARIGTSTRPSALRLYVAGDRPIQITEQTDYAAAIYAPQAPVLAIGTFGTTTYGSVFARSFEFRNFHVVHFDRAIIDVGEQCTEPLPARCDSCDQCPSGTACVDGTCGACRSDADCCEPLTCASGKCGPLLLE